MSSSQAFYYEPDYDYSDQDYYINRCAVCNDIHICDCNNADIESYGFFIHIDDDLISIPATPVNRYSMKNKKHKYRKIKENLPKPREYTPPNNSYSCNIIQLSFGCLYIAILYTCLF